MTDVDPKIYTAVETFVEFLTVAIYQILKERKIYPSSIFILARKYNPPVHQIRYPGLCAFLNSETAAIRQALLSKSVRRIFVAVFFQGLPQEHFVFDTAQMSRPKTTGTTTEGDEFDFLPHVDAEEQMRAGLSKPKDHCALLEPLNYQSTFRIAMVMDEDPAFHSYKKEQRNEISPAPTQNECCIEKHATQTIQIRSVKVGRLVFDLWYEPAKFPIYTSSQPSPSAMACTSPSDMYGVATLHAGNLKAYLDGISLVDVQAVLSRHFLQHQQDRSIFSYLIDPGDGVLPHEAASAVLGELASKTEDVAVLATLAYRLIDAKGLWKGHPDPSVKSAQDLIERLDSGCDVAQANIVIGASALRQRQNYARLIDEAWRPGWFESIPQAIRAPSWTRPEDLPRDVLVQITANAKQGIPMSTAVARWTQHITRRTDHGIRRRERIRGPTVPHLILSDIRPLNTPVKDSDKGRRTSDMFFPEDAPVDRLEVKLAALTSPSRPRPDYSAAGPASARKRKRDGLGTVEQSDVDGDAAAVQEEWHRGKDGMMVKRSKNHLIRRPPNADELVSLDSSPRLTQSSVDTTGERYVASRRHKDAPNDGSACDGPGIALVFGKFVDMYKELRSTDTDTARMTARCCDSCRVFVLRALASLEAELVPCVRGLEHVEQHLYDGETVRSSQDHGVPSRKATPGGKGVPRMRVAVDSSDDQEVD